MQDKQAETLGKQQKEEFLDLSKPNDVFHLIYNSKDDNETKPHIINHLKSLIDKSPLKDKYVILFSYDDMGQINRYTSNQIYSALSGRKTSEKADLLLILYSMGGLVEPAYLISKCCKEYANRFIVATPR